MLFYSVPHNCTAVGYLQYAIPKGFGAGKTRIQSVDERGNCDLSLPNRFFYFGNMCHSGICHIIVLSVGVISMLTYTVFDDKIYTWSVCVCAYVCVYMYVYIYRWTECSTNECSWTSG